MGSPKKIGKIIKLGTTKDGEWECSLGSKGPLCRFAKPWTGLGVDSDVYTLYLRTLD